jgi:hypothetical protein
MLSVGRIPHIAPEVVAADGPVLRRGGKVTGASEVSLERN